MDTASIITIIIQRWGSNQKEDRDIERIEVTLLYKEWWNIKNDDKGKENKNYKNRKKRKESDKKTEKRIGNEWMLYYYYYWQ